MQVAAPRLGLTPGDCGFYHWIDLPRSGPQEGTWDLRGRFDEYVGHYDFTGKRVLDIGTASGFLTFEAEKRGATVTSFDVSSAALWHRLPIRGTPFVADYPAWRAKADAEVERLRNSYWLAHEELESKATCVYGDVYEIDGPDRFDIVMLGQILVHLPDGLSALTAAARVCDEAMIVIEGSFPDDQALALLCGHADRPDVTEAWYHYSHGWYREVAAMLGFGEVTISTGMYSLNAAGYPRELELTTVVARRGPAPAPPRGPRGVRGLIRKVRGA